MAAVCCGMRCNQMVLFCSLATIIVLLVTAVRAQWDAEPQNVVVPMGGDTRVRCGVRDKGVVWKQYRGDSSLIMFVNESVFNAQPRFHVEKTSTGFDLVLSAAQMEDDADYECEVQGLQLKRRITITVTVMPGEPLMSLNVSATGLREGQWIQLNCSSWGGQPAPMFTWRRNGNALQGMSAVTYLPSLIKFGQSTSTLGWQLTRADHDANFSCTVTSTAYPSASPLIVSLQLVVNYKPVINFEPSFNPLVLIEQEPFFVTCQPDAVPPVAADDVIWYQEGTPEPIERGQVLRFTRVQRINSGNYTCEASNMIGKSKARQVIIVQYSPNLSILSNGIEVKDGELKVRENDQVSLTCVVDSMPRASIEDILWFKDSAQVAMGPTYNIDRIDRLNEGVYKCQATNRLQPSGKEERQQTTARTFQLTVMYKPGSATVSLDKTRVLIGDTVNLYCNATNYGQPQANLEWRRSGSQTVIHSGSQLVIQSIQLSHIALYTCTPTNIIGDGISASYWLDVIETPQWLGPSLTPQHQIKINESNEFAVTCEVRGRPTPSVTWLRNGLDVTASTLFSVVNHRTPLNTFSWNVSSTLTWKGDGRWPQPHSLRTDDNANYSCVISSNATLPEERLQASMLLDVWYMPTLDANNDKVAVDVNQSALLICRANGVPVPEFQWHYGSQSGHTTRLSPNERLHTSVNVKAGQYPYESTLAIINVLASDLGRYVCIVSNEMGAVHFPIELAVKTVPEVPYNLQITELTWESIEVSWTPGFDGGYAQYFLITFYSIGGVILTINANQSTRYNITELFPLTNYTLSVHGENILGAGLKSENRTVTTPDYVVAAPASVVYDRKQRLLHVLSPNESFCVRVHIADQTSAAWHLYEACAMLNEGHLKIKDEVVTTFRVALCLVRRPTFCSISVTAIKLSEGDLPLSVIIIVACVCGGLVLVLTIILIILCVRRREARRKFEEDLAAEMKKAENKKEKKDFLMSPVTKQSLSPTTLDHVDVIDLSHQGIYVDDLTYQMPTTARTLEKEKKATTNSSPYKVVPLGDNSANSRAERLYSKDKTLKSSESSSCQSQPLMPPAITSQSRAPVTAKTASNNNAHPVSLHQRPLNGQMIQQYPSNVQLSQQYSSNGQLYISNGQLASQPNVGGRPPSVLLAPHSQQPVANGHQYLANVQYRPQPSTHQRPPSVQLTSSAMPGGTQTNVYNSRQGQGQPRVDNQNNRLSQSSSTLQAGQSSTLSTPLSFSGNDLASADLPRPKKVIYEVVV